MSAIARIAKEALLAGKESSLAQDGELQDLTALDVFRACKQGDPLARDIFQFVGTVLGQKLLQVLYLLDPEIIIIGGGAAAAVEYLLAPIREVLEGRYFSKDLCPPVRTGVLCDSAGLIGAVHLSEYTKGL